MNDFPYYEGQIFPDKNIQEDIRPLVEYDDLFKLEKIPSYYETFKIKKTLTDVEIKKSYEVYKIMSSHDSDKWQPMFDTQYILHIKEIEIKLALIILINRVTEKYKEIAHYHGLPLHPEFFYDDVVVDFTYRDLVPGDTSISFEIYTKRWLRLKKNAK